jgi:hypothetical protein
MGHKLYTRDGTKIIHKPERRKHRTEKQCIATRGKVSGRRRQSKRKTNV